MNRKSFSPGDVIFHQGDKSASAYWILSGRVEICIESPAGNETIAMLSEGEIFGEMGMIDEQPRTATARASAPTEVEVIETADFYQQIVRREERLMRYLETIFERLRITNSLLRAHLGKGWEEARFASGPPVDHLEEKIPDLTILSTEASASLYPDGLKLRATRFPFRIGRRNDDGRMFSPMDLPLFDQPPYTVSPSHCRIECKGGGYFVRDVGSLSGTIVNGVTIGSDHPSLTATLRLGENELTIGPEGSVHRYWAMVG